MTEAKEGPRGFAVVVQQIDEGALHAELSETLQKIAGELADYAESTQGKAKGTLTLTLTLNASANGTVAVKGDVKSKTPKLARPGSMFWLTKGNNLSVENPRQTKLPLREVPSEKAREVSASETAARTV